MMRGWMAITMVVAIGFGAGCESLVYQYDCRGQLLNRDGTPAAGFPIHLETAPLPAGSKPAGWEKDVTQTSATLLDGRFRAFCTGGQYTAWFGIRRESPKLKRIYIWFQREGAWDQTAVPLVPDEQRFYWDGKREIFLPPITLPPAITRPARSSAGRS